MTNSNASGFSVDEQAQLKAFIEILDQAYLSENPAVKDALHQLMMITILCHGHKKSKRGPFKELFNKIKRVEDKLDNLKLDNLKLDRGDYNDFEKMIEDLKYYTSDNTKPHQWGTTIKNWPGTVGSGYASTQTAAKTTAGQATKAYSYLPDLVTNKLTESQLDAFFPDYESSPSKNVKK